jgi:glycosyltransferase 2 family protein
LLDRFSGLLSLGLIMAAYSSFVVKEKWIVILLITGALLAIPFLYFIIKKFFPDFVPGFWPTFLLGAAVQTAILLCIYFILFALSIRIDLNGYIFIFLIAATASVLPISVGGGLGVREFVIIEGAKYAGLDQHTALVISLLFYVITVTCSLIGLIFVFKNPIQQKSFTLK